MTQTTFCFILPNVHFPENKQGTYGGPMLSVSRVSLHFILLPLGGDILPLHEFAMQEVVNKWTQNVEKKEHSIKYVLPQSHELLLCVSLICVMSFLLHIVLSE